MTRWHKVIAFLGNGKEILYKWYMHMPRWPPCSYMVKSFKNLLQNQKSYDLETCHVALGTQAFINDDPGLTLTYFTARSNWVTCTF